MTPEQGFRMLRDDAVWHPYADASLVAPMAARRTRRPMRLVLGVAAAAAVVAVAVVAGVALRGWQAGRPMPVPPVAATPSAAPSPGDPVISTSTRVATVGIPFTISATGLVPRHTYAIYWRSWSDDSDVHHVAAYGPVLTEQTTDDAGAFVADVVFDADDVSAPDTTHDYTIEVGSDEVVDGSDPECSRDCQTPVPHSNSVTVTVGPAAADAPHLTASSSTTVFGEPVTLTASNLVPGREYAFDVESGWADFPVSIDGGGAWLSGSAVADASGAASVEVVIKDSPYLVGYPPTETFRFRVADDNTSTLATVEVVAGHR